MLFIHIEQDVILHFQKSSFSAMMHPVSWLSVRVKIRVDHVFGYLMEDCFLSELR